MKIIMFIAIVYILFGIALTIVVKNDTNDTSEWLCIDVLVSIEKDEDGLITEHHAVHCER